MINVSETMQDRKKGQKGKSQAGSFCIMLAVFLMLPGLYTMEIQTKQIKP